MQVLSNTSFGTLWLYTYELGTVDARGMVITPAVALQDEAGPYCQVYFTK